jgi:flagellar biosynthesis/type III secretory pathway protein FliH
MTIIRGEKICTTAALTSSKKLHFPETNEPLPFVEEQISAFKKGEVQGEKRGYERAMSETHMLFTLLQKLAEKLLEQKNHLLDQLKPEVIEFALAICERVIRKELSQPEIMVHLINSLLTFSTPQFRHDTLRIVLAPEDLIMLENHLSHIQFDKREIEGLRFHSDPLMRRGDCRIEGQNGVINHTISRELADLQAKILQ